MALVGCATTPRASFAPREISAKGYFHAVNCGGVNALWTGTAPAWGDKATGTESLTFEFIDTDSARDPTRRFKPGTLTFDDWSFAIFSPDCSHVALLVDRHGPIHVVPTSRLLEYLDGQAAPMAVQATVETEPKAHGQLRWTGPDTLEFVASCCGGAEAYEARVSGAEAAVRVLFFAAAAPRGLVRTPRGWELAPP